MYGGTKRRERTPLSPSPSPEPSGDAGGEGGERSAPLPTAQSNSTTTTSTTTTTTGAARAGADNAASTNEDNGNSGSHADVYGDPKQEAARRMLEERIRIAIDDLMQLATCAAEVHEGDEGVIQLKINETMESLQAIQDATNLPDLRHMVPEDVMSMIDCGRNPDIHTRTFTNRLNSDNQQMRGQAQNFDRYRDRLHDKLLQAFPEMEADLDAR